MWAGGVPADKMSPYARGRESGFGSRRAPVSVCKLDSGIAASVDPDRGHGIALRTYSYQFASGCSDDPAHAAEPLELAAFGSRSRKVHHLPDQRTTCGYEPGTGLIQSI